MGSRINQIVILSVVGAVALAAVSYALLFEDKHASKGRRLFAYYCTHCHGDKGQGNGYNSKYLDPKPRDLTDSVEPYMAEGSNDDIFLAIKYGVAGVISKETGLPENKSASGGEEDEAMGSPLMPYWGFTLSDGEIWSLVAYIRTLHQNDAEKIQFAESLESKRPRYQPVSKPEFNFSSDERAKLIETGKKLYEDKYACLSCHRIGETGGMVGPDLSRSGFRLNPQWTFRWIKYPQSMKPNTKMTNFGMSDQDAVAITLYLSTIK